jgi:Tfp pilus assembly protein PilF
MNKAQKITLHQRQETANVELAKAYLKDGDYQNAAQWLQSAAHHQQIWEALKGS